MKIPTSERPKLDETLDEDGLPPIINRMELTDWGEKLEAWYDERIIFNQSNNTCTLLFEYPYEIDLERIESVRDILEWTLHLLEKEWLTNEDITTIIERIAKFKRIKIYH